MTMMRTSEGIDLKLISRTFGDQVAVKLVEAAKPFSEDPKLLIVDSEFKTIRFTDPDGLLFSNTVLSSFILAVELMTDDVENKP